MRNSLYSTYGNQRELMRDIWHTLKWSKCLTLYNSFDKKKKKRSKPFRRQLSRCSYCALVAPARRRSPTPIRSIDDEWSTLIFATPRFDIVASRS